MSASPNPVNVYGTGVANKKTITVHEQSYVGPITQSNDCGAAATITTTNANGPDATFDVVGNSAVTCTATFHDGFNQTATTQIVVTTSGFVISGKKR